MRSDFVSLHELGETYTCSAKTPRMVVSANEQQKITIPENLEAFIVVVFGDHTKVECYANRCDIIVYGSFCQVHVGGYGNHITCRDTCEVRDSGCNNNTILDDPGSYYYCNGDTCYVQAYDGLGTINMADSTNGLIKCTGDETSEIIPGAGTTFFWNDVAYVEGVDFEIGEIYKGENEDELYKIDKHGNRVKLIE